MKHIVAAAALLSLSLMAACGGGDGKSTTSTPSSISFSLASTGDRSVDVASTSVALLTVSPSGTAFTLEVKPKTSSNAGGDGCRKEGDTVVCTPTKAGTYTITVTAADLAKSMDFTAKPVITITPDELSVETLSITDFTAVVQGVPDTKELQWTEPSCGDVMVLDDYGREIRFSAAKASSTTCKVTASVYEGSTKLASEDVAITITDPSLDTVLGKMTMVTGGTFAMGCTDGECMDTELSQRDTTLGNFSIGQYEVTQWLWEKVMGSTSNPSNNKAGNLPVENVKWEDIVGKTGNGKCLEKNGITYYNNGFICRLNDVSERTYRLPTEAEWEYAARGGKAGIAHDYKYSGSNDANAVAWYADNSDVDDTGKKTQPVGMRQANELGLYDMSGNVYEWTSDVFEQTTNSHVVKGGGYGSEKVFVRASYRGGYAATITDNFVLSSLGFRLASD